MLLPENDVGPFGKITPMCIELGYKTNFHIRLECSNTRLHLKDTIVGKLIFCRLTIEISKIELSLIRK